MYCIRDSLTVNPFWLHISSFQATPKPTQWYGVRQCERKEASCSAKQMHFEDTVSVVGMLGLGFPFSGQLSIEIEEPPWNGSRRSLGGGWCAVGLPLRGQGF